MNIKLIIPLLLTLIFLACSNESSKKDNGDIKKINVSEKLDVQPTEVTITGINDTLIFGEQGTAIFIEANSLVLENGSTPEGEINIIIKEYYSLSDIVLQNLTTSSNGELLETGGMIHIEAYSNENLLKLKYGKEIVVHFPKNGNQENKKMNLFSGELNEQNQVVWNEEPKSEGYVKDSINYWYHKLDGLDDHSLWLEDGRHVYDWIEEEIILTKEEQDYVMFKDLNLYYTVTENGDLKDIRFKKKVNKNFEKRMIGIVSKIPKLKPYSVLGKPIEMEGWLKFEVIVVPPKYGSNQNYLNSIENKYPDFEQKSINDISKTELHYYIFNSAKLGWLNVDRFVNDPSTKINMSLKVKKPEDVMIKMVYKDYKSVIPPEFEGKTHYFNGIPNGKEITIIVIRYGEKNVEMSITEQLTKEGKITNLDFKNYTMGELRTELEKLN